MNRLPFLGARVYTIPMSEEIIIDNVEYVSSKRAAEISGYAQDYVGQLARSGAIDAKRIGGLWYISLSSIESHKKKTETVAKEQLAAKREMQREPDTIISFEGRDYVSAARAAKVSGYNQDYVGQLARSGKILSRQVGSRWYVDRESLLAHKREKDALLAALQVESVGLAGKGGVDFTAQGAVSTDTSPFFTYKSDTRDLIPALTSAVAQEARPRMFGENDRQTGGVHENEQRIPIAISHDKRHVRASASYQRERIYTPPSPRRRKTAVYGTLAATLATIVVVLSLGVTTLREQSLYAAVATSREAFLSTHYGSAIAAGLARIGDTLEDLLVPEMTYRRIQ